MKMKKDARHDDEKKLIRTGWLTFIAALVLALALEFARDPHPAFGMEGEPFFFAWFGFSACVAIILLSKLLGGLLKRSKTYYGEKD